MAKLEEGEQRILDRAREKEAMADKIIFELSGSSDFLFRKYFLAALEVALGKKPIISQYLVSDIWMITTP